MGGGLCELSTPWICEIYDGAVIYSTVQYSKVQGQDKNEENS